ncbi:hypothetical protein T265_09743 [Opisthorchis viverrini]|uniref:Uncharacterized protein n=1 Tax=Opisthorchis viverrini TaxID=6198 RepID=A0A074Z934_OPIVI|nr:hypothetical protein T265_09743 [Opisthorchis viverrini]KER22092.1 hypothetical protein T265_09743 [Opisthorchis viverrini]
MKYLSSAHSRVSEASNAKSSPDIPITVLEFVFMKLEGEHTLHSHYMDRSLQTLVMDDLEIEKSRRSTGAMGTQTQIDTIGTYESRKLNPVDPDGRESHLVSEIYGH